MGEDEFAEVYAATYKPLLGYALRRCDSPEDAADVVAETFTIAWRRATDMPAGPQARLWLYGVARRVLANGTRPRANVPPPAAASPAPGHAAPTWSASCSPPRNPTPSPPRPTDRPRRRPRFPRPASWGFLSADWRVSG